MQLDMKDMRYTTAGSQIYVEQHALHNFSKILEFFFGEHGNLITFFFFSSNQHSWGLKKMAFF